MFPYAYIGGRLVPSEEAQVSIASPSMQYGLTCFGGMMAYYRNGRFRLLRLRDHYQRLIAGARTMGMDISLTYDEFRSVVRELLDANAPKGDVYIRPFLMTPDACIAPRPGSSFELAAFMMPMDGYYSENDGLHLQISSWRKFPDAALPTAIPAEAVIFSFGDPHDQITVSRHRTAFGEEWFGEKSEERHAGEYGVLGRLGGV